MKFTCRVIIDRPIGPVIEKFEDTNSLGEWQDGFVSFVHLNGDRGAVGSTSSMRYKVRNREISIIETILVNNLPEEFMGRYVAKEMTNTMRNLFTEVEENSTQWEAHVEYTKVNGLIPKLMMKLMPGMFKKQVQKWMDQFKAFVERS